MTASRVTAIAAVIIAIVAVVALLQSQPSNSIPCDPPGSCGRYFDLNGGE